MHDGRMTDMQKRKGKILNKRKPAQFPETEKSSRGRRREVFWQPIAVFTSAPSVKPPNTVTWSEMRRKASQV